MPKFIITIIGLLLTASLLAFLPGSLLLALLVASGGLLCLLHWPWLGWLGLAFILPVSSGIKFGALSLTEVVLVGVIGLWFMDGVRQRSLALRGSLVVLGPLLYAFALYLAAFQAVDLDEAVAEVVKWLEFTAVFLLVRSSVPTRRRPWLVLALLCAAVGQALFGLYQFIFQVGPDWFIILGRYMRASGSFQQPNPYGGYLGLTLPVAVSLAIWAWATLVQEWLNRWQGNRTQKAKGQEHRPAVHPLFQPRPGSSLISQANWLWACLYTALAGLIAAGLLTSWSRGAWIGAALAVGTVVVVRSRRLAVASAVAGLGLLVALLLGILQPNMVPPAIAQRVQDIPAYLGFGDVLNHPVTDENFAILERLAHWVAAQRMWERSPWLGVGPGNFSIVYPAVRLPRWDVPLGHAHNIYLNVLAESGLVGLAAFVIFWGSVGWWVVRQRYQISGTSADWHQALAVGVLGVLVHLAVHSFFDNLFVQGMYLHLAFWLGVLDQTEVY